MKKKQLIHAGVAVINITPPLDLNPILGGYGDRMSQPAIGVHDYIYAKAIVTADMQSFPPYFKSQLVESFYVVSYKKKQYVIF